MSPCVGPFQTVLVEEDARREWERNAILLFIPGGLFLVPLAFHSTLFSIAGT